ncbi:MAG: hypothetical protein FJ257_00425 [Phycisphaerae bacterium]|nr:hypothetical protein [Phycisphaerae bacterium]
MAKCIFSRARRWKLVPENPFEHLRARPQSTPDRAVCVRHEVVQRIIDQCPRPQWRANAHFEVAIRDMPRVGEVEAQAAPIRATA